MADSFKVTTVTASIAAQSITVTRADGTSGALTIYDVGGIPAAVNQDQCPVLRPRPRDFISGFKFTRDSQGGNASKKTARYVLTYQMLYAPVGQTGVPYEHYGDMVNALVATVLYFMDHGDDIAGATDFVVGPLPLVAGLPDSVGTAFHGGEIQFTVEQFLEA